MLNGPWSENADDGKPIFIDRDPENFRHILAVLRDPQHQVPNNLLYELDYFQMEWAKPKKKDPTLVELVADAENRTDGSTRIFGAQDSSGTTGAHLMLSCFGNADIFRSDQIPCHGCPKPIEREPSPSAYIRRTINPINHSPFSYFMLERIGDTITDMILRFQLAEKEWRPDYDPRYDAIESVEFRIGANTIDKIVGPALQLLDIIHMPSEKRHNRKILEANTHVISVRLPFFFCGASRRHHLPSSPFPFWLAPYSDFRIHIQFNPTMIVDCCYLDVEYCMLGTPLKRQINNNSTQKGKSFDIRIWQHQYERCDINQATNHHRFRFRYHFPTHAFYWMVQGKETGTIYPIANTLIKLSHHLIYDCSDRTNREYMLLDPECHATGLIPVYYWNLHDSSLDGNRIGDLTWEITMPCSYYEEPLEFIVMAKTRNYMRFQDGISRFWFN
jgi:hypothetical protein